MIKVLEKDFEKEIKDKKILVDFYADWCGPCKMQAEILHAVDFIDILNVDVDKFSDLARSFGVMSIPTLILFENGKLIKQHVGMMNESQLKEFIS